MSVKTGPPEIPVPPDRRPRLYFAHGEVPAVEEGHRGREPNEFVLTGDLTTIGSGPDVDLRLVGLAPRHAEIRRTGQDEFRYVHVGPRSAPSRVDGRPVLEWTLHTGDRVQVGEHTFSFARDETAEPGPDYPHHEPTGRRFMDRWESLVLRGYGPPPLGRKP